MMKKVIYTLLLFFIVGCTNDNAPDCFKAVGDLVKVEVEVADFSKITVYEGVQLIIKKGEKIKIEIETGEYLLNEISAVVEDGRLLLKNENSCNLFRNYNVTKIYVTTPILSEIRSNTGTEISSDGVFVFSEFSNCMQIIMEKNLMIITIMEVST